MPTDYRCYIADSVHEIDLEVYEDVEAGNAASAAADAVEEEYLESGDPYFECQRESTVFVLCPDDRLVEVVVTSTPTVIFSGKEADSPDSTKEELEAARQRILESGV